MNKKLSEKLTTLNFRPSTEFGKWSVIFPHFGSIRERKFETEDEAVNFAKSYDIHEITYDPLYLNKRTYEEFK